jgi:lysyl-tRNA synthetase class 2
LAPTHILESFDDLKTLVDIGDWIGVVGGIKRTDKGELSVLVGKWAMLTKEKKISKVLYIVTSYCKYARALTFEILTKTILPLPDKYKGLTDVNIRYRRRYLDLIVNSEVRETFRKRAAIVQGVRSYLTKENHSKRSST